MVTISEAAQMIADLVVKFEGNHDQLSVIMTGSATGGQDGYYPYTAPDGAVVQVASPNKLAALAGVAISTGGNGTTDNAAAFLAAQAARQQNRLTAGIYRISSSLTLTGVWIFEPGAMILVPDGVTLSVNAIIFAGAWQIFTGWPADTSSIRVATANDKSRIVFLRNQTLLPEWFGAVGDNIANDKPAWQRLGYAFPEYGSILCRQQATYLFDNGGMADRSDRPCHALFSQKRWVDLDLNGATLRLANNTKYSILVFTGSAAQTPVNRFFRLHGGGTLDGNRAGNEAQYIAQWQAGQSSASKGYGALVFIQGFMQALVEGVHVKDPIHSGVDAQECEVVVFSGNRATGGFPMQWNVHADQSHYFAARRNYMGRVFFRDIDAEGGSHHITAHTNVNDLDPVTESRTACYIDGYNGLNWSESGIHVEQMEVCHIINFDMEINDAALSSANVADLFVRAFSTRPVGGRHISVSITNGSMRNGCVTVNDELGNDDNRTGRVAIDNVHVSKSINGLLAEPRIEAANSGKVTNCTVLGTAATPITRKAITAKVATDCTVDYAQGVDVYDKFTGKVTNASVEGVKLLSSGDALVDAVITDCQVGINANGARLEARGRIARTQRSAIRSDVPAGYLKALGMRIEDWGLDATAAYADRAAVGGTNTNGDGASSPDIEVRDTTFARIDANCSTQTVRATQAGNKVVLIDNRGIGAGLLGPQFTAGAESYMQPLIGQETVTSWQAVLDQSSNTVGARFFWQAYRDLQLALSSAATITHINSATSSAAMIKGVTVTVTINNANAAFDFTQPNVTRDGQTSYALRHASKTTWSPAAGAVMRMTFLGSYWMCETIDA
ncbi:hypothetical protein CLG96_02145 [Sphingomonas oleivorans]|uniref:Uncharacterized protein n=1 Tax=Sphingomonas oleivorans TaxID=1735121 RepID=A0A2T5G1E1_9SPHN|nr:hypothetical protein [Sphingomonas oleivorans]PTQ12966.1 hypothetical protein CLG96_02145 [Sphingomonas oleivorans]